MLNVQNKKRLQIVLLVLVAVLILGVGYASISAINLIINGNATATANQNNFKVKFLSEQGVTPIIEGSPQNTVSVDSDTTSSFNISTLNSAGQSVIVTYKVKNESIGIGANIALQLTSTNNEYFKVSEKIVDDTLQAGEETIVTVKVEMLKTPIDNAVTTTVTATLVATPIDNAVATGGKEKEEIRPTSNSYIYINSDAGCYFGYIGREIPDCQLQFSSFAEAKASFYDYPAVIAIETEGGLISKTYIAFEMNNNVYYLRGGVDESSLDNQPIYDSNIQTLKEAFGENWADKCESYSNDSFSTFSCIEESEPRLSIGISNFGEIESSDGRDSYLSKIAVDSGEIYYYMYY